MHAGRRMAQHLWAGFRRARPGDVEYPARMGRPQDGLPGRAGPAAAACLRAGCRTGASRLEGCARRLAGLHVPPHNKTRGILKEPVELPRHGELLGNEMRLNQDFRRRPR